MRKPLFASRLDGKAARTLCTWLRHAAQLCAPPWLAGLDACVEAQLARQNSSLTKLSEDAFIWCLDRFVLGRQAVIAAPMPPIPKLRVDECGGPIWLAAIVRFQSASIPYWLIWHLLMGVSHVLIYDNNRHGQF